MRVPTLATKFTLALTSLALTVSFCVTLLCYLFVRSELSYDGSIPSQERIYRLNLTINPPGSEPVILPTVTAQTGPALGAIAGVEASTRLSFEDILIVLDGAPRREAAYVVDPNFISFFGLDMPLGNPEIALRDPGTVVLSDEAATRLFGSLDIVGREIEVSGSLLRVTGIVDAPANLHFDPQFLVSSATASTRLGAADRGGSQGEFFAHTYLRLDQAANRDAVGRSIAELPRSAPIMPPPQVDALRPGLTLLPVADIHLHGLPVGELEPGGNRELVWAIMAVGALILATACLNLAILVGADADSRLREIGVRRAFGANRAQILASFALRYAVITAGCMGVAIAVSVPLLPFVSQQLGRALFLQVPADIGALLAIPLVALLAAVMALALSSSSSVNAAPAVALQGELARRGTFWRAAAASVQFALSIILISSTLIVGAQVSLAIHDSLAIGDDEVLILDGLNPPFPASSQRTLTALAGSIDGAISVGLSEIVPTDMSTTMVGLMNPAAGQQQPSGFQANSADSGFFETYGVSAIAGRVFTDEEAEGNIVLSQSAASSLGFLSPQDAVDRSISMVSANGLIPFTVIGIVPDVPMKSIEGGAERLVFTNVADRARYLSVRVDPGAAARVREELLRAWASFSPTTPRILSLRDRLAELYGPLTQAFLFFGGLAATALAIAALGIAAAASFTAERRHKEMGLRRALGASRLNVAAELSSALLGPLIIASAAAIPVAVIASQGWLAGFARRTPLTAAPFGIAVMLVIGIALAAAGSQIIPLVSTRPADAMRRDQ